MKKQVAAVIRDLETAHNIRILYACESGSRAWGFASPDSDYDIRFIYAHSRNWYLSLQAQQDHIDTFLPGDLDLAGWDLAKALRLFSSCNLSLNEWLGSPEVYYSADDFEVELTTLTEKFFNPRKAMHHYLSMAKKVYEKNSDNSKIGIKKLFYVVRPLCCCAWIEKYTDMPPTAFQNLLDANLAPTTVTEQIHKIRQMKETAMEGEVIEIPHELQQWITTGLSHFETSAFSCASSNKINWQVLDQLFLKWTV